ncbi:Golgi UDP-galactose transmembrane transporter Gms1 [Schizosaccharomyces osmophilus]|uniref:Golgi UDP-galactose transmembrane transporter Gms1 n=1 Tax=Schizosaccharomyces osmophilus TaxID=2545709 RepID=A0AAF0AWS5_9SCHI|nr:Golgi UDP-galactose transmembrane transporter Gms1 [Schizosaccharomyces osmophilus]WBW73340.1 Golgi UDP-galactose transmembrane transporter Gms1 [Schizosaccharomyces osmophilus]
MAGKGDEVKLGGIPMKYIALALLTVQNSALILTLNYSRIMPGYADKRYFTSTAVLLNEMIKLTVCFVIGYYQFRRNVGSEARLRTFLSQIFGGDSWKLGIPAFLYTCQNNLQYVAAGNLSVAIFQVTYQLKILTTAIFSVALLHRKLGLTKWLSLFILTGGIAIVQLQNLASDSKSPVDSSMNPLTGFTAVLIACLISGLAGVYFEKVLKGTNPSLWVRNVQLSFFSIVPCIFTIAVSDYSNIVQKGFFYGYNPVVWLAILLQAFGGIIVALCVAFADNIMKNFSTSISIILSSLVSVYLLDFKITFAFVVGVGLVIAATFLYTKPEQKPADQGNYIPLTTQEAVSSDAAESNAYKT